MVSFAHVGLGAALAASSALGVAVRTGRVDLGRRRWLHHALYATSLAAAAGAIVVDGPRHRPTWPVAAGTLGVLVLLPATSGGSRPHIALATTAATLYVAGTAASATSGGAR